MIDCLNIVSIRVEDVGCIVLGVVFWMQLGRDPTPTATNEGTGIEGVNRLFARTDKRYMCIDGGMLTPVDPKVICSLDPKANAFFRLSLQGVAKCGEGSYVK